MAIWLKVDNAIIFFISCSHIAAILAYTAVNDEINIREWEHTGWLKFIIRRSIYTPAVTKVDEWTRAEIGVGADIAAGSQAEKGNWALFDIAAIINITIIIKLKFSFIEKFQFII